MAKYHPERFWPRLVPQNAITGSIYNRELGHAYGLITDLSEWGACVDTDVDFEPGTSVLLRIRFSSEGDPFVTEAEIVWRREQANRYMPRFVLRVKFSLSSDEQRSVLKTALLGVEAQP